MVAAPGSADLAVRALARTAQHWIVLSAVVPPVAQGDAVLTRLEASLLLIATRGLSDGDALVDAGESLAYALGRDPRDVDSRPRGDHPAVVDEDTSSEREVAVRRYLQTVNILSFIEEVDCSNNVIRGLASMRPPSVVMQADPTSDLDPTIGTRMELGRVLATLLASNPALVVVDEVLPPALPIRGDRGEEFSPSRGHVGQDVSRPALGVEESPFRRRRLCCERRHPGGFKFGRLPMLVPLH